MRNPLLEFMALESMAMSRPKRRIGDFGSIPGPKRAELDPYQSKPARGLAIGDSELDRTTAD
jgi:hypothetical protein